MGADEYGFEGVRPDLIQRSRAKDNVRIWSAGSSSGEEIHTLMMFLLGEDKHEGKAIARGDLLVLASDLAAHAVNASEAAAYDVEAVSKLPAALLKPVGATICQRIEG